MNNGGPNAVTGQEYGVTCRLRDNNVYIRNKIVVDFGCGVGGYSHNIANVAKIVISLDVSKQFLKRTKELCKTNANVNVVNACGEYAPIRSECIDTIMSFEVLEHVSEPNSYLIECERILRKESTFLISIPNKFYPFETHGMRLSQKYIRNFLHVGIPFLSWMPKTIRKRLATSRIYTQKEMIAALQTHGFIICSYNYLMPPFDGIQIESKTLLHLRNAIRTVERVIEKIPFIRCFGTHVMLKCKK